MDKYPDISLKHLHYFKVIYEKRSYTAAAKELAISQNTLRAVIKSLEQKLENSLFYKNREILEPTKKGISLFKTTNYMLGSFEDSHLSFIKEEKTQHELNVVASTTVSQYLLPNIIKKILEEFPNYSINVLSGPEYFKDIFLNKFDFVLGPKLSIAGLKCLKIGAFRYYLCISDNYPRPLDHVQSIDDIQNENLLLFSGNHLLPESFVQANKVIIKSSSYPFLEKLCKNGEGILSMLSCPDMYENLIPLTQIGAVEEEDAYAYLHAHSPHLQICERMVELAVEASNFQLKNIGDKHEKN